MGKTNFQYDETGTTYYYVLLTFLGLFLLPSTYFLWPTLVSSSETDEPIDPEKRRKYVSAAAKGTVYWQACSEKAARMSKKDPWVGTRRRLAYIFLLVGWTLFAFAVYQASQFDYELANFDPYDILQVSYDASAKEIKKKYREMSLQYHPDKPTGNEKLFMKLTKAYNALTDETARYNWEHYGNPDGPQAMEFGIGLPAWIVDEKNSIFVLSIYTLIFMIGLPTSVYYWWSNSHKFSGEQVLRDTTQLYYYFFHKTPHMMLKRVLMVLAASLEFERGHNPEVVDRPTDNREIPQLIKALPLLGINNKEKPICYAYSVKARALIFAHLSRIALPYSTLHVDRLFVIKKCPNLIQEIVQCISQLVLLAHAGRIARLPSLDTIEYAMKCSSMIVQAMWEKSSPLLQLPHIDEEILRHFTTNRRNIKTLQQLAKMKDEDRRLLLRSLTEEQYSDVTRVLSLMPLLTAKVTTEVVDDEEQHVVTAGAIVTVTVSLNRSTMDSLMTGVATGKLDKESVSEDHEDMEVIDTDEVAEALNNEQHESKVNNNESEKKLKFAKKAEKNNNNGSCAAFNNGEEDDEEEWQRLQKRMIKREKVLEGKSRISHSVHSPYFPDDKQEHWWVYISDRNNQALLTPPKQVTSLVDQEEIELIFTAPHKPGPYSFTVCIRSDSYLGVDVQEDIKVDVCEAKEAPSDHPQWEFEDEEDEAEAKDSDSDGEFATDDDYDEDEDEDED